MHLCQNFSEWKFCRPATIIIMVIIVMNILVMIIFIVIIIMINHSHNCHHHCHDYLGHGHHCQDYRTSPSHTCKPSEDKNRQRSGLWRPSWSSRLSLEMRTPENKIMSSLLFSSYMYVDQNRHLIHTFNRPLGKHL